MSGLGIKIKVDYSTIDDLAKKIEQLSKDKLEIDLNLNVEKSLGKLKDFQSKYDALKQNIEKGLDLKINTGSGFDKTLEGMKDNATKVENVISEAREQASKMSEQFKNSDSSLSSLTRSVKNLANGTKQTTNTMTSDMNSYSKTVETIVDGEKKSLKTMIDKKGALKEIANTMSQITDLNIKSLSSDDKSKGVIEQRTTALKSQLSTLQELYKNTFGEDSSKSKIVQEAKSLGEYNTQLKRISVEKQNQAQYDKETADILKQVVQLENERYSLSKRSTGTGDNESSELKKQASLIQDKSNELIKQSGLLDRITVGQANSLNVLRKENDASVEYTANLAKAKAQDATRAQAQAQSYREIKSQMQDVYAIQEKITSLSALKNNGSINSKEESRLTSLKQELAVRKDLLNLTKKEAGQDGLTGKQQDSLSALQKEKAYKLQSAQATAEINAEARKTAQYYDEIASSMRKVHSLSNELADAGNAESRVINSIIKLEERRQQAIRDTLSAQGRINNAKEDELDILRKQDRELQQQNEHRSKSRQYDNLGKNGFLGNMFNPTSIINDAKQIASTIYDSIAPIDEQLVNIAKVAEEPQEELDAFSKTIYKTASEVGKSAEEYGISVERWITAGKDLEESTALAKTSVMGSFVGNIGESDMVDYMSVPLNAYKKDALEANDIINAMNEVANKNAIEMDDMGSAYKRAASTSAQAGTSFAQLTGIITAGQEATRVGGETLGTAIKAMDVNFGKMATRTTKSDNDRFEFFQNLGVQVKDSNGQLRSTFDILQDLSGVWGKLSNDQKTQAGFYAAGKHFSNVFAGILGNWDVVTKATKEAQSQVELIDSTTGSAFKEFERQQSSIQFKAANLKNSWAEFLNTVAGGKDGVTKVLASLNDGLQLANKLAADDGIRKIATNLLKVVATLTAATAISKFFSIITSGSRDVLRSLAGVNSALSKTSKIAGAYKVTRATEGLNTATKVANVAKVSNTGTKVAKGARVADAVGDVAEVAVATRGMGKVTGAITKTTTAAKGLATGMRGALGTFLSFGSKAVPVVGGVLTGIELLEALGVPVWGTMFNLVKKFTGGTDEATASLQKYKAKQEETKKSISDNKLLNGQIKQNNDLIKSYKELSEAKIKTLQEKKQKAEENGENFDIDLNLNLEPDEFNKLKKEFNDKAKSLGIDTRITVNNWEDIKAKFKELEEVNLKVTKVETAKLGKDLKTLGLYDDVQKQFDTFNKKSDKKRKQKLEQYETSSKYGNKDVQDLNKEQTKDVNRYKDQRGDFYASSEMSKMESEVSKRIKTLNSTRESLYNAMNQGVLQDTFAGFDETAQKQSLALLASKLPILEKEKNQYATINKQIEAGGSLSKEQANQLTKAGIKLGSLSEDTGSWLEQLTQINNGDTDAAQEQYNSLINSIKNLGNASNESQANLENNLRTLGETAGMSKQDVEYMIALSKKGGADYIEYMARFGDMGATIVGVTAKIQTAAAQYKTTWSEIAADAQRSADIISKMDGGREKLLKFKIVNEDGNVNFDAIDDAYAFPDEVKKKFNLVNTETGTLNVAQIADYLAQVNSQQNKQFLLSLGVEGEVDMETISQLYKLPPEVRKTFKIINEKTGDIDWKSFAEEINKLPEETIKKFKFNTDVNEDGKVDLQDTIAILKELSQSDLNEITTKVTAKVEGEKDLEAIRKKANDTGGKEYIIALKAQDNASRVTELVKNNAETIGKGDYTAFLKANEVNANTSIEDVSARLAVYNQLSPEARLNANNQDAIRKFAESYGLVVTFDQTTGEAKFVGNSEDVKTKAGEAEKAKQQGSGTANTNFTGDASDVTTKSGQAVTAGAQGNGSSNWTFTAVLDGAWDAVQKFFGGGTKKIAPGAGGTEGSVGIQTGSSFSSSIGSQIGSSLSSAIQEGVSQSTSETPATVSEDVWRYWSKELFTGLPLETSLDKLSKSIDASKDNQDQLISLYKQQISLYDKQINYQNSLRGSYQDEINSVIGKLRGYGFSSSGNNITNLGQARNLSGDQASEADKLLSRWKELFTSINNTQKTINELSSSKTQAQDSIKDAQTAKELKELEKVIKRSEAILKIIENNTSIQNTKEGFVGSTDYELSLTIKEQGLNSSITNVKNLVDEYNKLATKTVDYAENAEQVQSTLDSLKNTILSNADAIIKYREELASIRIDRLVSDYDKFSEFINSSVTKISDNIDSLKAGLVSGTTLSDLYSSQFGSLDLTRKSKLEKDQEERLKLEAELDSALDGYAKKNIDRTETVANSILSIEKDKYTKLLQLAKSYTDGTPLEISTKTVDTTGTGFSGVQPSQDNSGYAEWTNGLKKITEEYNKAYGDMIKKYDEAVKKASNGAEKDLITNDMIIAQLKMQEEMYQKIISTNNQMVANAEKELENTSLTTEQRDKLLESITKYKNANSDAQKSIKESIGARYEFEFSLIDKATEKAEKYSKNLDYLLNVANLINMSASSKSSIYEAIFAGKINEYSTAKKNLESLIKEQSKFEEGSYEWKLLQEKILAVKDSLQELTVDALNANKELLDNTLDATKDRFEKGLLGGKTLDEWNDYQDNWETGIGKEIALENLRKRMVGLEDKTIEKRLEMLDKQESLSKKDAEYLDKQIAVLELQKKLNGIEKERNVQTLVRGNDGKWSWDYVADQTEYDSTKKELDDAKLALEEYRNEQRKGYVESLGGIIDKAKEGEYKTPEDLASAIANLNSVYGNILSDIPGITQGGSLQDIITAYQQYLLANNAIAGNALGTSTALTQQTIDNIGLRFEASFLNIADKLAEIIGNELRNALGLASADDTGTTYGNYTIQNQELQFPNVTDASGIEDVFRNLPEITKQLAQKK